ncbi:Nup133p [Kluyveromyces lactis]|uniref:KLLA0A07909p n=1 Tax=Kluyveromyces lactis (strain ATCC 8585 / CBS 2359 / DSM 70799 / NBRC 1267 / NRRL Y-1140 / WM37) TaxID=284590 RepID=Q6CXI7_KLULA|nr:uncharacterized protein KLLA0_A07909g [Kluyveromyces lactis]CAH02940.1 KLLA0A07909p [Kluyveromyces lactis]|eukprot:XP_451352.1 uncharacterized protein KLLA0_A07909g [Kluyveromyces lactis]
MKQLFQLRKELSVPAAAPEDSVISAEETTTGSAVTNVQFSNEQVITENGKYKVSKLAPSLSFLPSNVELCCSVDAKSGYALCCDTDNVYVWPFLSSETHPSFVRIPLHDEEYESWSRPPLCCFTWPSVLERDLKSSPGLFLVNSRSGDIQFYEDVDTVSQVASFLTQTKRHKSVLKLRDGEYVENLINAEPAGILLSTNYGRVEFCTIRDANGKPFVSLKQTIIKCQVGIFSSMSKSKRVVSLKLGEISGKGERIVSILTQGGRYQVWNLSSVGNCYKKIDLNVQSEISQAVLEHFPLATSTLKLLDCHPLSGDSDAYLFLSFLAESNETHYLLSTIIVDEDTNSFAIFSTYRLNTYTRPLSDEFAPRLIVPTAYTKEHLPITSVYTLFSDAAVLTQTSSKLDSNYPFKRKWEDIIRFNKDMKVLGYDCNSSSLYITDGRTCALKLETFEKYENSDFQEIRFIKSHVDQYVYFGGQSTDSLLDFNLPDNLDLQPQEIETDIQMSSDEIKYALSNHIPPVANNPMKHLKIRSELFERLLTFVAHNFLDQTSSQFKLDLISDFEMIKCLESLYSLLPQQPTSISQAWKTVLSESSYQSDSDFISDGIVKIPELLGAFLKHLKDLMKSTNETMLKSQIAKLINQLVYHSILEECENSYRYGLFQMSPDDVSKNIPWFTTNSIIENLNDIFFLLRHASEDLAVVSEFVEELLLLVKSLFYMVRQITMWIDANAITDSSYKQFFEENHLLWNRVLRDVNRSQDSILITDFYQDFEGLVETLQSLPKITAFSLYDEFFQKYGYDFAKSLFSYYIKEGLWDDLYESFGETHSEYLDQFLGECPEYGKVKWIGNIYCHKYDEATTTLLSISTGTQSLGQDLKQRQAQLSIAKLTALAAEVQDLEKLNEIQTELDLIDGQILLSQELQESTLNPLFKDFTTYRTLFKYLSDAVKRRESLSVPHMIELFTLLNQDTSYGFALSILAIDHTLPTEVKKYCEYQIWRRCLLSDENAVRQTLRVFFKQQFYHQSIELPIIDNLANEKLITDSYLDGMYHGLTDLNKLASDVKREVALFANSNLDVTMLQSIIGEINEETGNQCVINYATNTIETSPTSF